MMSIFDKAKAMLNTAEEKLEATAGQASAKAAELADKVAVAADQA